MTCLEHTLQNLDPLNRILATSFLTVTQKINMKDDRAEELFKDLRKLIDMLKGTESQYGLLDWVDTYYSDYTEEALNLCNDMENKYLNSND